MKTIAKKVLIVMFCISIMLMNVTVYATTGNNTNSEELSKDILKTGYEGNLTSDVEIKILPSINSSAIATINKDTEFKIVDVMNKWCHIQTENADGWVLLSKVTSKATESNNKDNLDKNNTTENSVASSESKTKVTKYVSAESLNVREKPNTDSRIISEVFLNNEVTVIENNGDGWVKIQKGDLTGYVAEKYLSDEKTTVSSRSSGTTRSKAVTNTTNNSNSQKTSQSYDTTTVSGGSGSSVVAYAKQFLGYRYVSGGSTPATGFDCSGFTSYVYSHFGIKLNRTTSGQNSNGTYVDKSNLQPGDILVFRNRSNTSIGHVGIYIGGDSFIHAENARAGVAIGSMSSSYYAPRYVGARRIMN